MSPEEQPAIVEKNVRIKIIYIIICFLIVILLAVSALYISLFSSYKNLEKQIAEINKDTSNSGLVNKTESNIEEGKNLQPDFESPKTEPVKSDDSMVNYVNKRLGFSIKIPKTAANPYGGCNWVEDEDKSSYRPKIVVTPVKTFENESSVYISFEYSYELTDRISDNGHTYFKGCEKVENNIAQLQQERRTWNIISKQVKSDTELDAFIKQRFGSSCSLGEKTTTIQPGVFSVRVNGDGKDLEFTNCALNYMFIIRYAPAVQKVFTFDRGQSFAFSKTLDYSEVYDGEMENSFRVLLP